MQVREPMQPCCATAQLSMHRGQARRPGRQARQARLEAGMQARQAGAAAGGHLGGSGGLPRGLAAAARQPCCPGVVDRVVHERQQLLCQPAAAQRRRSWHRDISASPATATAEGRALQACPTASPSPQLLPLPLPQSLLPSSPLPPSGLPCHLASPAIYPPLPPPCATYRSASMKPVHCRMGAPAAAG